MATSEQVLQKKTIQIKKIDKKLKESTLDVSWAPFNNNTKTS